MTTLAKLEEEYIQQANIAHANEGTPKGERAAKRMAEILIEQMIELTRLNKQQKAEAK